MQNNIFSPWLCKKHFYRKAKSKAKGSDKFVYNLNKIQKISEQKQFET
jgi:hypothetical protein